MFFLCTVLVTQHFNSMIGIRDSSRQRSTKEPTTMGLIHSSRCKLTVYSDRSSNLEYQVYHHYEAPVVLLWSKVGVVLLSAWPAAKAAALHNPGIS